MQRQYGKKRRPARARPFFLPLLGGSPSGSCGRPRPSSGVRSAGIGKKGTRAGGRTWSGTGRSMVGGPVEDGLSLAVPRSGSHAMAILRYNSGKTAGGINHGSRTSDRINQGSRGVAAPKAVLYCKKLLAEHPIDGLEFLCGFPGPQHSCRNSAGNRLPWAG